VTPSPPWSKQTGSIEQAAGKLGISDLNPDNADHEF